MPNHWHMGISCYLCIFVYFHTAYSYYLCILVFSHMWPSLVCERHVGYLPAAQVHKALTEHILAAEAPLVAAAPTCDTVAHGACSEAFDVNGGSTVVCGEGPGSFRTYDKCSNRTNCQIAISQAMRDAVAAMCTANPLAAPQPPPPLPTTKPPPTNAPAQAPSSQSGASSTVKSSAASAALPAGLALVSPAAIVACIMVLKLAAAGVSS
jgi:hypothetical protein